MTVSATGYVQQQAFAAPRSDRDDLRVSLIRPAIQQHKPISGSEQEGMRQMIERKK